MASRFSKFGPAPRKENWLPSIFGGGNSGGASGTPAPAPAPAPAPPAPSPAPAAPAPDPANPVSHLAQFEGLWQTATDANGKPIPIAADPLAQPTFQLDPAKINESIGKIDFAASIPPETLGKISAGGQEAVTAFAEALNIGLRNAVAGLTLSQGQMLNQAIAANNQRITTSLPAHIKRTQLLDSAEDDPVFKHPAVQPLVNSLKQMQLAKNPNASAAEINALVANYIRGLGAAVHETSPEVVNSRKQQAKGEQDWSSFLE
jgi:hypothetical protein